MTKDKKTDVLERCKPSICLDNKEIDNISEFRINEDVILKGYGKIKSISKYQESNGDRYTMSIEFDNIKVVASDLSKIEKVKSLKDLKELEKEL